jgi:hypothetical protein
VTTLVPECPDSYGPVLDLLGLFDMFGVSHAVHLHDLVIDALFATQQNAQLVIHSFRADRSIPSL